MDRLTIGICAIEFLNCSSSVSWISVDYVGNAGATVLPVVYEVNGLDWTYTSEEPLESVSKSQMAKYEYAYSKILLCKIPVDVFDFDFRSDLKAAYD
jgi:hypothetical protein